MDHIVKRKTLLINSDYQLRIAILEVGSAILTMNIFIIAGVLFPSVLGIGITLSQKGSFIIVFAEIMLLTAVWFFSIKYSHRVAGAMFVFKKVLKQIEQGDFSSRVRLRNSDEFQDVADAINEAIIVTNKRLLQINEQVQLLEKVDAQKKIENIRVVMEEFKLDENNEK